MSVLRLAGSPWMMLDLPATTTWTSERRPLRPLLPGGGAARPSSSWLFLEPGILVPDPGQGGVEPHHANGNGHLRALVTSLPQTCLQSLEEGARFPCHPSCMVLMAAEERSGH
jgi:hypothetical protein